MLRCASASDPGRVRTNNEDRVWIDTERGIFLVVDGVGGQAAGEKAAEIAVERIRGRLERQTGSLEERIREAITVANNEILREARAHPEWAGMACVLTVAVVDDGSAVIGHVGDSRLYKLRRGTIEKITHDHSPVGVREDARELSEAEAMRHPRRNEVYRDVGSEEHAPDDDGFIETVRIPFESDAALLLCSDGLSDMVTSAEIGRTVARHAGDPCAAVRALIGAANREGGKDNVSVVLVAGERFGPRRAGAPGMFTGRGAMFLYGFSAALAIAALLYFRYGRPPASPPPEQVLVVGAGQPFAAIADAVAKARPGDTVEVLAGEFREQIRMKSGVAVRSRVPGGAILRTPPVDPPVAVMAQGVRDARLSGFRILADERMAAGVLIEDADVEIDGLEIAGPEAGMEIRGGSRPVLRGNSIHDCGAGLIIGGAGAPVVSHNALVNGKRPAVVVRDAARPAFTGNVFDSPAAVTGADAAQIAKFNFFLRGRR
ncbi:MAG: protein phosphatase 2C domain-containing protein [Bryobacteraceae bacterium]